MTLPRLSIERPITTVMLTAVVLALGFVALRGLPLDLLPSLEFPVAAVITSYEGAGPREVENMVTRPIEEAVATVSNVTNIYSTSSRGQSLVLVQFDWGTDMDFATLEMRERIDLIQGFLPDEVDKPMVVKFDPAQIPIIALVLEGNTPPERLRELADEVVAPRLERLDGVASVGTAGGRERQIQVLVRPSALQAYGVTVEQIAQRLAAENINLPGGSIVEGGREYLLRTSGEFQSVDEIAALRITTPTGAQVALRDLADVQDTYADITEITRLNGNPSVGLSIQKEAQANTVEVARRVRAEIQKIEADLGPGYRVLTVFDQAEFIELSIQQLVQNALVGALLAGLILYVFLRNLRATLVVVLSVPISVIATFVLVYFAGISLNIISLGGLALGVGMLVDNSIVVLESIFRHRTLGKPAREAADVGAREVGMAITASTLTTVAVFVPVLFIEGIASQIFRDLALTVSFSLIASLVVAVTLVPLLASRMLDAPSVLRAVEDARWVERLKDAYARALAWTLKHRRAAVAVIVVAFAGSLALVPRIGSEFIPSTDQGIIRMTVTMPVGTPLAQTAEVVHQLEAAIQAIPEVAMVYASTGSGSSNLGLSLGSGTGGDQATLQIALVPLDQRSRSSAEVAEEIRGLASRIPGIEYSVSAENMLVSLGGSPISIELRGENEAELAAVAEELAARIRAIPGTREVETSLDTQRPEYTLQVRRERAQDLGLTAPQIAATLQAAVDGKVATRFRGGGEEIDVVVRLVPEARQDLDALSRIPIASPVAGMVPLGEVAAFTRTDAPLSLERSNQARVISVTGQVVGRDLGSVM
ncbi:MAG TPA: efflux RND transporter permease subunit, partial [Limnochorda sp.]